MKRITTLSILIILIFPFIFSSCEKEEEFGKDFWVGIPSSGTYFKIQVDNTIWEGDIDSFKQMYVKTEPDGSDYKTFDFVVCTELENGINVIQKKVYINVKVNDDNYFSNYRVQYIKEKSGPVNGHYNFDEWMEYKTGSLTIVKKDEIKMTAKFKGTLKAANNYREDADVMIYFQEFPINPTYSK